MWVRMGVGSNPVGGARGIGQGQGWVLGWEGEGTSPVINVGIVRTERFALCVRVSELDEAIRRYTTEAPEATLGTA